jgi:4-aminobutyrate aminotransferase
MGGKTPYPKIVVTPPGPKARELVRDDESLISRSMVRWYPLVAESGSGCIVRDVDGNEFIDFNSGLAVLNVGHCHPRVVSSIAEQSKKLIHYSYTDFYYQPIIDLANELTKITPGAFAKKVFFCNSGAETVEAAMKMAKWHTRNSLFIAYTGAFHGRTLGSVSLTASKPVQRRHFFPLVPGVTHVPYPYCYRCPFHLSYPECHLWCVDFIEEEILAKYIPAENVAAMFVESIQGEAGYVVPPDEYFLRLRKLLDKYSILMIDDEIQSGIGRTGKWFAMEHFNVIPNVVCVAKAIGSGLPIGALISKDDLMDWEGGSHATTFGGNPVSCVAGLAVIDVIRQERLLDNAIRLGAHLMTRLKEMQKKYPIIGDVRGKGLMVGAEIVKDPDTKEFGSELSQAIIMKCFKRGLAMVTSGKSTMRFAPPLVITRDLLDAGLDVFEGVVKEVSGSVK